MSSNTVFPNWKQCVTGQTVNSEQRERLATWAGAAMVALVGLVLFSWVALGASTEPGRFGAPGRVALKMANLPGNVHKAWTEAWDNITGAEATVTAQLLVSRLTADRMQVATARPIIVNAGSVALAEGVEALREIAGQLQQLARDASDRLPVVNRRKSRVKSVVMRAPVL